jgi:hypothetical protein
MDNREHIKRIAGAIATVIEEGRYEPFQIISLAGKMEDLAWHDTGFDKGDPEPSHETLRAAAVAAGYR